MKKTFVKLFFVLVLMAGIMSCQKDVNPTVVGAKTSDAIMATETSTQPVTLATDLAPVRPDIKRLPASLVIPNFPCTVSGARGYTNLRQSVNFCVTNRREAGTEWLWDEYSCNRGVNHTGELLWRGVGTITGCGKDTSTPTLSAAPGQGATPDHGGIAGLPPEMVNSREKCDVPGASGYANLEKTASPCICRKTGEKSFYWIWWEYTCSKIGDDKEPHWNFSSKEIGCENPN